ncbi:MAG TPA: hypothetical protein VLB49_14860 [Gemmatimonadales bacterium]|nr:hypothetical protein [Gemmatimonadales bacterium]
MSDLASQGGAGGGTVSGELRHGGPTGAPLAGRWVVLHQVTSGGGGPVDSVRTDAAGRWRLRARQVDTMAIYIASALHDGLAYFSPPLRVQAGKAVTADPLVVYDTSSGGPGIVLQRRLVTITGAGEDGSREVLELLELGHEGQQTRVAPDTVRPVWTVSIPAAAVQFEVQTGDFSPDAVTRRGDSVLLFAPVQPGRNRQLSYRYVLPSSAAGTVTIPIDQPTAELDLLLEDTVAAVSAPGLTGGGVEQIETRRFAGYRADSLPAGAPVSIVFPAKQFRTDRLLPLLVVAIVAALGVGLWVALKRGEGAGSGERGTAPSRRTGKKE